jgi:hypothetical protein
VPLINGPSNWPPLASSPAKKLVSRSVAAASAAAMTGSFLLGVKRQVLHGSAVRAENRSKNVSHKVSAIQSHSLNAIKIITLYNFD